MENMSVKALKQATRCWSVVEASCQKEVMYYQLSLEEL